MTTTLMINLIFLSFWNYLKGAEAELVLFLRPYNIEGAVDTTAYLHPHLREDSDSGFLAYY